MNDCFGKNRRLEDSAFFATQICIKKMQDGSFSFFHRKWCLMVGIGTVKQSGFRKFPDSVQGKIIAVSVIFCKSKGWLF